MSARAGRRRRGFTLIELAVVMAVISLLLAGLLVPLRTQIDQARYQAAVDQLAATKKALIAYAIANGNRLPCPDDDTDGDGLPDPPEGHAPPGTGACDDPEGLLPWAVLGVPQFDPWGSPVRYRANAAFTQRAGVPVPPLADAGSAFDVWTRDPPGATPARMLSLAGTEAPAAIVYSCGKNRRADEDNFDGAVSPVGCTGDPVVDTRYTADAFLEGVFDDVVDWLSAPALCTRLIAAGTWPARGR